MISCYAVKERFYNTLKKHPDLLKDLFLLSDEQKNCMLEYIVKEEIRKSAQSFFDVPIIEEQNQLQMILYGNQINVIHFHDGIVDVDRENNPFLEVLKRKYPYFIMEDIK